MGVGEAVGMGLGVDRRTGIEALGLGSGVVDPLLPSDQTAQTSIITKAAPTNTLVMAAYVSRRLYNHLWEPSAQTSSTLPLLYSRT